MTPSVQSRGEEIANSVSHGVGFLMALAGLPILIVHAAGQGGVASVVGGTLFGSTMALLYLASALYHAVGPGRAKRVLRRLDHGAIFLLIAGTYTPFTLGVLGGGWGWALFGVVWGMAMVGILMKLVFGPRFPRVSSILYLVMGWMVLIAVRPLWEALPGWGFVLLGLGGLFYTVGILFYLAPERRYAHFIWHLFVMAGTTLHFFAVLLYAV